MFPAICLRCSRPEQATSCQGGTQKSKALLADEPTTGLDTCSCLHTAGHSIGTCAWLQDTFQAADMVQLLGELGKARRCATILLAAEC